ncbi:MAG: septum formation protein Maf [Bacteroidetes bacterium]|jgi:septum formation protein|nr:septum formation protein Maf [Bacteroidota bacterium]
MILHELVNDTKIILASQSPRRQHLLKELQIPFEIIVRDCDETYPENMEPMDVPAYLVNKKSESYTDLIADKTLIITADTVVINEHSIIGKPENETDAVRLLQTISNNTHLVVSGVCLRTSDKQRVFSSLTKVTFRQLGQDEIDYYIRQFSPMDKAGAYGIQEWIGFIGVEKIEGSFFNVMGLPTQQLYTEMLNILK